MNTLHDCPEVKSVYISGPMTGIPEGNRQAFSDATEKIRDLDLGIEIVNPSELDAASGLSSEELAKVESGDIEWGELLKRDLEHVLAVDAVIAIEGWQQSRGAKLEIFLAASLSKPVFGIRDLEIIPIGELPKVEEHGSILDHAKRRTSPERREQLGHPYDDCKRIAGMITEITGHEIMPDEIPLILMVVKISRFIDHPNANSLADIGGYAQIMADIADYKGGYHKTEVGAHKSSSDTDATSGH